MVEQNSTPKKRAVGSLFFHLFNRFSLGIYTLLCSCFAGRVLTSYEVLEKRWSRICELVFGPASGKFRRNLHNLRVAVAGHMERSKLMLLLSNTVRFLIYCPLNIFGVFFFVYGALGAAVYFIGDRLSVNYAGDIGWGIAGIVIVISSLPLLCSNKPLYFAAFGSRTLGKILRNYLGLERRGTPEKRERGNTILFYLALLLGAGFGTLTFFYHPATVPLCVGLLAISLVVLYIPEAGVLLALASVPFWWCTGHPAICAIAISGITLVGFAGKLIRGRRVMHLRLIDFCVLVLGLVIAVNGAMVSAGMLSALYIVGYLVMMAMYFPVVNLMHSPEWMDRCYRLLVVSGAVLSVMNLLSFVNLQGMIDNLPAGSDLSMFSVLLERYNTYFSNPVAIGGMLILLIPIMLSGTIGKKSMSSVFWRSLWVLAGCASLVLFMQFGAWMGLVVAVVVFFFVYSYKTLSVSILLAFPLSCGAVWAIDVDRMLGVHRMEPVLAVQNVVVTFCDGAGQRLRVMQSVREMVKDNVLGIGWGSEALAASFPQYAQPGTQSLTEVPNTFLQLLAGSGWGALLMLVAVLIAFLLCSMTYLRWSAYNVSKARVAAGLAGVIGLLLMGTTCNVWGSGSVFMLFWLVIALSVASIRTQYESVARAVRTHGMTAEQADVSWRNKINQ